jgi:hypothetical protein
MESKTKQVQAYEWMLSLTEVPLAQRHNVMAGAAVFFDRGWPSNHFTVGMAAEAALGLTPPVYEGIGTEGRYFQAMKDQSQAAEPGRQLAAPDCAANCNGDRPSEAPTETGGCTEWHRIDGSDGSIAEVRM